MPDVPVVKVPWYKDNENRKDIATLLGVIAELVNAYSKSIPPGVAVGVGILLRASLNYFGTVKTVVGLVLFCLLMGSPASANPLFAPLNPPAGGEDAFVIAPIGSIEFNPSTKDNYGLALTESLSFAKILQGQDDKHVIVAPYVFVGFFCAANIGQWVATNGGANWQFDYGPMVGLPKLDESIPEVAFSYNLRDGQFMINVAFPADILPSILVHKL